jgi:membrane-associated phospholipid phosphatase
MSAPDARTAGAAHAPGRVPPRARRALGLAALVSVALVSCWYAAFHDVTLARADAHAYFAFLSLSLHHRELASLARRVADLCLPSPFVFLAAVPVLVALARRRWVLALGLAVMIPAAIVSSELLKPLLAAPRPALGVANAPIGTGSWPSGHSTAAMILAMACLLASPARWRPYVALAGTLFSLAVIYSVLSLGWHYPSDALGGIMVASIWTLLTVAAVVVVEAHYGRDLARLNSFSPERGGWLAHLPSPLALVAAAALPALVVCLARGHRPVAYAAGHTAFVAALVSIAGLVALASTFATTALNGARRSPRSAHR